jgi:hypothetical protein
MINVSPAVQGELAEEEDIVVRESRDTERSCNIKNSRNKMQQELLP